MKAERRLNHGGNDLETKREDAMLNSLRPWRRVSDGRGKFGKPAVDSLCARGGSCSGKAALMAKRPPGLGRTHRSTVVDFAERKKKRRKQAKP